MPLKVSSPRFPLDASRPPGDPVSHVSTLALALLAAMLLLGHLPLLTKFFLDLWTRPQYQFFPITLATAAFLAWDRTRESARAGFEPGSARISATLFAAAFLLLAAGAWLWVRWFAPLAACFTLAAIVWRRGGRRLALALRPVALLLLWVIPPPLHLDNALTLGLQTLAVRNAGGLLDRLNVPHLVSGNVIEVPGRRLMIEEACSGINSLMAVIAFALAWGFWHRYRRLHTFVLVVCAGAMVLWANVFRIVSATLMLVHWHVDLFRGALHEWFGWAIFVVSLGLLLCLDCFLHAAEQGDHPRSEGDPTAPNAPPSSDRSVYPPSPANGLAGLKPHATSSTNILRLGRLPWAIGVAFLLIGLRTQARVRHAWPSSRLPPGATFSLPKQLAGWQRIDTNEPILGRAELIGRDSFIWTYRSNGLTAAVAFDYPFVGYHNLTTCYLSTGWTILESQSMGTPPQASTSLAADNADPFERLRMRKQPIFFGHLLFALCDESGRWLTAGPGIAGDLSIDRVTQVATSPASYQVQAFVQSYTPLSPPDEARVQSLFQDARRDLLQQLQTHVNRPAR